MEKKIFIQEMKPLPNGLFRFIFVEDGAEKYIDGGSCPNARFLDFGSDGGYLQVDFESVYGIQNE